MEEKLLAEFTEDLSSEDEALVKKMFDAGLHWGRRRSLTHPKMRPFIFSSRGDLEIIDIVKTLEGLREAMGAVRNIVSAGGSFLIIGSQPAAREEVKRVAEELGFPYVNARWFGGTLTNFKTFQERLSDLRGLEAKIQSDEFSNYTKKERLDFQRRRDELKEKFAGVLSMAELPAALFMIGIARHETAVREAIRCGITVIAVTNTSDNPTIAEVAIPANDNSVSGIAFILSEFREAVLEGRKQRVVKAEETVQSAPEKQ